ncbi:MAG TPA: DUF2934 domain-containing protein [Myxococcota bacterium]|nr:DUF2934 domain-containing protein [Myxococcota bacterium]
MPPKKKSSEAVSSSASPRPRRTKLTAMSARASEPTVEAVPEAVVSMATPGVDTASVLHPVEATEVHAPVETSLSPEERHRRIAEAAYYKYLERGANGSHDRDDWLEAEAEMERGGHGHGSSHP